MNKFYYTYKIVCLLGSFKDCYYLGKRVAHLNPENDGYAGSGTKLCNYYKKYGKIKGVTFYKIIICFYNSLEELNEGEKILIGDLYKTDPMCLNLKEGGEGGGAKGIHKGKTPWNKGKKLSEETKQKMANSHKGIHHSEETCRLLSEKQKGHPNYMHHQPEEAKKKQSEAFKGRHWILDENGKRHWI